MSCADHCAHELLLGWSDRYDDEPCPREPEEVPAVLHRIFQPWQHDPLGEGHGGIDVRPKKIPDRPLLRTSIRFEFGDETELGQHNMAPTLVAMEFVQGIQELAVAPGFLGLQKLVNDQKLVLV